MTMISPSVQNQNKIFITAKVMKLIYLQSLNIKIKKKIYVYNCIYIFIKHLMYRYNISTYLIQFLSNFCKTKCLNYIIYITYVIYTNNSITF